MSFNTAVAEAVARCASRRALVRVGRFLLNCGRMDGANTIATNGELMVLRTALKSCDPKGSAIVDIGANTGAWMLACARCAVTGGVTGLTIHAFEPSSATYQLLHQASLRVPASVGVKLLRYGVSDRSGPQELYVPEAGSGISSLYHESAGMRRGTGEVVELITLSRYVEMCGLRRLDLVKSDAEGHDYYVIAGALPLLAERRVSAIQFEYNWRWIHARRYLKDVFDLLRDHDYAIGKVTRRGIEVYADWHQELETYVEGNYVIILRTLLDGWPVVRWWRHP